MGCTVGKYRVHPVSEVRALPARAAAPPRARNDRSPSLVALDCLPVSARALLGKGGIDREERVSFTRESNRSQRAGLLGVQAATKHGTELIDHLRRRAEAERQERERVAALGLKSEEINAAKVHGRTEEHKLSQKWLAAIAKPKLYNKFKDDEQMFFTRPQRLRLESMVDAAYRKKVAASVAMPYWSFKYTDSGPSTPPASLARRFPDVAQGCPRGLEATLPCAREV